MKILLDECVPWPMQKFLSDHECSPPAQCGWGGIQNGELLRKAEGQFDVFITSDQNIRYQQNLAARSIPIIELSTNNLRRILTASSSIRAAIAEVKTGEFRRLEI